MYRSSDVSITAVAATNVWKKGGTLCEDSANGFFATPNFAGLGAVVRGTDAESDRQRDGPAYSSSKHVHVSTFKVVCENSRREMYVA
jgi:hypothetical protein